MADSEAEQRAEQRAKAAAGKLVIRKGATAQAEDPVAAIAAAARARREAEWRAQQLAKVSADAERKRQERQNRRQLVERLKAGAEQRKRQADAEAEARRRWAEIERSKLPNEATRQRIEEIKKAAGIDTSAGDATSSLYGKHTSAVARRAAAAQAKRSHSHTPSRAHTTTRPHTASALVYATRATGTWRPAAATIGGEGQAARGSIPYDGHETRLVVSKHSQEEAGWFVEDMPREDDQARRAPVEPPMSFLLKPKPTSGHANNTGPFPHPNISDLPGQAPRSEEEKREERRQRRRREMEWRAAQKARHNVEAMQAAFDRESRRRIYSSMKDKAARETWVVASVRREPPRAAPTSPKSSDGKAHGHEASSSHRSGRQTSWDGRHFALAVSSRTGPVLPSQFCAWG